MTSSSVSPWTSELFRFEEPIDGIRVTYFQTSSRENYSGNNKPRVALSEISITDADGNLLGFCVTEIMEDGADPFGMICDLLVKEGSRCGGVGTALMENAIAWLHSMGVTEVYLESGLHNHAAHEYFMRRGFRKVSEIYKLI